MVAAVVVPRSLLLAKALFSPCAHILLFTKTALLRKIGALNPCERTLSLCRTDLYGLLTVQ